MTNHDVTRFFAISKGKPKKLRLPKSDSLLVGIYLKFFFYSYAEYIAVPKIEYLVKVPVNMELSVASMLPSGALWAMNTVFVAQNHVEKILAEKGESGIMLL